MRWFSQVNPLVKQAVEWLPLGKGPFKPRDMDVLQLRKFFRYHLKHSPIVTRNIVDRFYRYVAENPGEAFERPMQELFIPMREDLIRMYPGYKATSLSEWTQEAEIRDFLRRMRRMPRKKFPFMIGPENPKEIDFAPLLNNEYYRRIPVRFHRNEKAKSITQAITNEATDPGVAGSSFPSESIRPGVRLPYIAAIAMHRDGQLPTGVIVHETMHTMQPIRFDAAQYVTHGPQGEQIETTPRGHELTLLSLMPYIAKRETEMLANTGKVTPMGALQHALSWIDEWKEQQRYVRRQGFPKANFWDSPKGRRYLRWLDDRFREAFQGQELIHRIGQWALKNKDTNYMSRVGGWTTDLSLHAGQLLVWDALRKQGILPKEITAAKMLKFIQDLPEGSPVHDFLMYGPAPRRDYWELVADARRGLAQYGPHNPDFEATPEELLESAKTIDNAIMRVI